MSAPAQDILLIGAGGHALSCLDVILARGDFRVLGLIGTAQDLGRSVLGHRVLGTDSDLPKHMALGRAALVAVGQITSPDLRIRLFQALQALGFDLPAIVSPFAVVSPNALIGAGSIVMHGAIVNAGARVGRNCIVNSRALIEHGAEIGDHCHISTGAVVNGDVRIGMGSFIGSGAVLREGITLDARAVVPMGTVQKSKTVQKSNKAVGPK